MSFRLVASDRARVADGLLCKDMIRVFDSTIEAIDYCLSSPGEVVYTEEDSRFEVWFYDSSSRPYGRFVPCDYAPGSVGFFSKLDEYHSFLHGGK